MFVSKKKPYTKFLYFILLSYGLSAFFWLPALLEKHNIALSRIPIANRSIYFVNLDQLLIPKWGYGLPDSPNGFSYQIGSAHIVTFLIVAGLSVLSIATRKLKDFNRFFAIVGSATTVILILLMFPFTKIIWETTPLLREINYPWTLLALIGFLISLLAGFLWIQKTFIKYLAIILCLFAIVLTFPHAKPEYFIDKGDGYYLTNDATTTSSDELMPVWVKEKPVKRLDKKVEIIKGEGEIKSIIYDSKKLTFKTDLKKDSSIQINTIYWEGWNAFIDEKKTNISYNNPKGLIRISIPPGKHNVEANFQESPIRFISDLVSVISLAVALLLVLRKHNLKR